MALWNLLCSGGRLVQTVTWRRLMSSVSDLQNFIFKETGRVPSRRNPSLGPLPRPEEHKPHPVHDPLNAYKITQDAKREAEQSGRTQRMVDQVAEKLGRKRNGGKIRPGDTSDEVPF